VHDDDPEVFSTVRRQTARSGQIDYGPAVPVHASSRTRIMFVPYYIPHATGPPRLAGFLQRLTPDPQTGVWMEQERINLDEAATERLLRILEEHAAVAERGTTGEFVLIPVERGVADVGALDPATVSHAVAAILREPNVVERLVADDLGENLTTALRGALRIHELRRAVAELRDNLEREVADEHVYQRWCQRHSWAFGMAYIDADRLRRISAGDDVDLLLPTVLAGLRDIVELKRPDAEVIRWDDGHRDYYWAPETSKAIGQATRYLEVLHDEARRGLRDHPEVVAYYPRAVVVIGRSDDWDDERYRGLRALNDRLHGITVMTFDQLLAQGERLLDVIGDEPAAGPPAGF
jgi:hypothetical protein